MEEDIRWTGNVARLGKMRNAYNILVGKPEKRNHVEGLGTEGMLEKQGGKVWTEFIWLRTR
jgi:hypothetical protein